MSYQVDRAHSFRFELSSTLGGIRTHTSRVSGEVTLSYTRPTSTQILRLSCLLFRRALCELPVLCVNSFFFLATARIAADPRFAPANQAGRNSRAELRSLSPTSFNRRSNSPPRHPGVSVAQPLLLTPSFEAAVLFSLPVGTIGPRLYFFELLPRSCRGRSLDRLFFLKASEHRTRTLPGSSPGRSTEVTRTFTTPESFCRGNQRPERHLALPFEPQQLAPLAGFEPATVVRSNSRLHHSANPCGGNHRPWSSYLSAALSLSFSNFRHWWESNPRPSEPDVTQAFTTPQTLDFFLRLLIISLVHYFSSAHTNSVTL